MVAFICTKVILNLCKKFKELFTIYVLVRKNYDETLKESIDQKEKIFNNINEAQLLAQKLNSNLKENKHWEVQKY